MSSAAYWYVPFAALYFAGVCRLIVRNLNMLRRSTP
jgi:hypothetical protein